MNSSVVNRAIRSLAWPVLRERGFTSFTSRTAWRYRDHLIDIVNFQSFNSYNAGVIGCTTFSFVINLSIYLANVPSDHPPKMRQDRLQPVESQGHIRRRLSPASSSLPKMKDLWFVDEQGLNTDDTVARAAFELAETADAWFAAFGNQSVVLSAMRDAIALPDEFTWLPGTSDSAARNTVVGYVALALGDRETATTYLRRALEQYKGFDSRTAEISRRFEKMTPRHLERTVETLSIEAP